jgi:hypothetical protein
MQEETGGEAVFIVERSVAADDFDRNAVDLGRVPVVPLLPRQVRNLVTGCDELFCEGPVLFLPAALGPWE